MYILGIKSGGHESTACLIKDGVIVAAVEEERFNRIKHAKGFPHQAMQWCLKEAGITLAEVDIVTSPLNPWKNLSNMALHFVRYFPRTLGLLKERADAVGRFSYFTEEELVYKSAGISKDRCHFKFLPVEHHLAHAASAFYLSPHEKSAIMTIDAIGEWTSTMLGVGNGTEMRKLKEIGFPHSLGFFYQTFTQYLGFEVNEGEGKVMGLAPYGDPEKYIDLFRKMVYPTDDGGFRLDLDYFDFHIYGHSKMLSDKAMQVLAAPRNPGGEILQYHKDIAAALQKRLEEICIHMAHWLHKETGLTTVCLAGGVALNSVMNTKLFEETPFKTVYVQAAASDSGAVLGAAVLASVKELGQRPPIMDTAYLGPECTDGEFAAALTNYGLKFAQVENIEEVTAKHLAEGKIFGWFQGRCELGPRALGNRSILADPRKAEMKDIINSRVKHRESFRPFAPSVLAEHAAEYFDLRGNESPFMLLVPTVWEKKRKVIPAVTHVDHTARVQTVRQEQNPRYYKLISEFNKLTGVPILLDTSFNIRGEPIVNTPEQAIEMYMKEDMDGLVLGNYLVLKR